MGPAPKCHFVPRLPNGCPKIPKVGIPATLGAHNFVWRLRKFSNFMWHATYTQGNRGDSRLLVVGSPSFGHNLCFKCPNGSCNPILDIYVPRTDQWYEEFLNSNRFWPLQSLSKDSEVHEDSNSQSGNSLGSVRVPSRTLSYTPKNMRCDSWVALLARTLASLCLGCKLKARVATSMTTSMSQRYFRFIFVVINVFMSSFTFTTKVLYFARTYLARENMEFHLVFTLCGNFNPLVSNNLRKVQYSKCLFGVNDK